MSKEIEITSANENLIEIEDDTENNFEIGEDVTGTGNNNYNNLENKPKINNIELKDNKTAKDLKLQSEMKRITNFEIEDIFSDF